MNKTPLFLDALMFCFILKLCVQGREMSKFVFHEICELSYCSYFNVMSLGHEPIMIMITLVKRGHQMFFFFSPEKATRKEQRLEAEKAFSKVSGFATLSKAKKLCIPQSSVNSQVSFEFT